MSMEGIKKIGKGEDFFEKGFETVHAAVFFVDETNRRIGMLKRAAGLDFAPNLFTGVGGKIEKGEGHRAGIIREIQEEIKGDIPEVENITEIGRVIVNGKGIVSYFVLPYSGNVLPVADATVGAVQWVPFEQILNLDLIPTARHFFEEWHKRGFTRIDSFTIQLQREKFEDVHSSVISLEIKDGLLTD